MKCAVGVGGRSARGGSRACTTRSCLQSAAEWFYSPPCRLPRSRTPISSPAVGGRPAGLGRAGQPLLAVRVRDHVAGLPPPGARRRGRLPGRLHPYLAASRRPAGRHRRAALDRPRSPGGCASIACAPAPGGARRGAARDRGHQRRAGRGRRGADGARGLKQLPEHCAEILDRFFARDESYRTIGEALDLSPGTIASRISRCLRKLRAQLEGRKERFQPSDGLPRGQGQRTDRQIRRGTFGCAAQDASPRTRGVGPGRPGIAPGPARDRRDRRTSPGAMRSSVPRSRQISESALEQAGYDIDPSLLPELEDRL